MEEPIPPKTTPLPPTLRDCGGASKKLVYKLRSGSHEEQGPRKTMEDTHKCIDDVRREQQLQQETDGGSGGEGGGTFTIGAAYEQIAYYGVYDGHGGAQTAKMVVDSLHPKILTSDHFTSGNVIDAIRSGFEEMDKYVVEEANKQNLMHGCTCVCSLVLDGTVYFANIGDSEGILVSIENGVVVPKNMTKAHKASEPSEKERIESLGGHVFFGRVYGSLAVSRSFGDAKYKRPKTSRDFVSWEPYTEIVQLSHHHKYMILACDGLFDVMNHQEVADMTHRLFEAGKDPNTVARQLVHRAVRELQTEDNVTVIVIKIDWAEEELQTTPSDTQTKLDTIDHPPTTTTTDGTVSPSCEDKAQISSSDSPEPITQSSDDIKE